MGAIFSKLRLLLLGLALSSIIVGQLLISWTFLFNWEDVHQYTVRNGARKWFNSDKDTVPVWIVDEHNEAAIYLPHLSRDQKALVLHIDTHSDMLPPLWERSHTRGGGSVFRPAKSTYIIDAIRRNDAGSATDFVWIHTDRSQECMRLCKEEPLWTQCEVCAIDRGTAEKLYPKPILGNAKFCAQSQIDEEVFEYFKYTNDNFDCDLQSHPRRYRTFWSSITQANEATHGKILNAIDSLNGTHDKFILDIDLDFFTQPNIITNIAQPVYLYNVVNRKGSARAQLCKVLTEFGACIFDMLLDPLQVANYFLDHYLQLDYTHFFSAEAHPNISSVLPQSQACTEWHATVQSLLTQLTRDEVAMLKAAQRGEGLSRLCFLDANRKAANFKNQLNSVRSLLQRLKRVQML